MHILNPCILAAVVTVTNSLSLYKSSFWQMIKSKTKFGFQVCIKAKEMFERPKPSERKDENLLIYEDLLWSAVIGRQHDSSMTFLC